MIDDEGGTAHYRFNFEYDKEKSGGESKKTYLCRVKSTLRIVLQVRGSKDITENCMGEEKDRIP